MPNNNKVFYNLKNYICRLFDTSLIYILERYQKVVPEYDYHVIKRWLLEMCFNSARVNASIDQHPSFPSLLLYILGQSETIRARCNSLCNYRMPATSPMTC